MKRYYYKINNEPVQFYCENKIKVINSKTKVESHKSICSTTENCEFKLEKNNANYCLEK